jgi:hypothetical protein
MKSTALKKLIKESVKEVFQEELKEVLLEAVRSPKPTPLNENFNPTSITPPPVNSGKSMMEKRKGYMDILEQTKLNFTSKDVPQQFTPQGTNASTSTTGTLPAGEVGMDQIMGLLNK